MLTYCQNFELINYHPIDRKFSAKMIFTVLCSPLNVGFLKIHIYFAIWTRLLLIEGEVNVRLYHY